MIRPHFLSSLAAAAGLFLFLPFLSKGQEAAKSSPRSIGTKAQSYVEQVSRSEALKSSVFGVFAATKGGEALASWNEGQRMVPASTAKLITTGAALHKLGPGFKYLTRIAHDGAVKDGVLEGNLYILGGGDPTIASKDSIAVPRFFLFSKWKAMLDKVGIRRIDGLVIGDGRYFDGPVELDTWASQDLGTADGAGGDGLCFYENAFDVNVSHGASVGEPVKYELGYPSIPWVRFSSTARTSKAGSGDKLYLFNSDVYPYAEMRGSFAIDRGPKTERFSNKFGAYTCAHNFRNYLESKQIRVLGGVADVRSGRIRQDLDSLEPGPYAAKVDELTILGGTESPTLVQIAKATNHKSDNFYAETLFRTLGRRLHHSASYDSSYVAVTEVLTELGAEPSEVQLVDGSGLSRHNYVSPSYFVDFLSAMMDSPVFGDYVGTLGQPGGSGYRSRLLGESEGLKSRVHLKSGSMNGVRCFCGYIEPSEGTKEETIIFSVMTNNSLVGAGRIDPIIDRIIVLLAAEN